MRPVEVRAPKKNRSIVITKYLSIPFAGFLIIHFLNELGHCVEKGRAWPISGPNWRLSGPGQCDNICFLGITVVFVVKEVCFLTASVPKAKSTEVGGGGDQPPLGWFDHLLGPLPGP